MLFVRDDGNVGIGTTSPSAPLAIVRSGDGPEIDTTSAYGRIMLFSGYSDNWAYFEAGNTDFSGNMSGGLKITGYYGNSLNALHLLSNTIYASGDVGIGITSPGEKLEVNGNIKVGSSDSYLIGSVKICSGSGSPNTVVSAPLGSLYLNTSGGSGTTLYVKESGGTGNTGWVAK